MMRTPVGSSPRELHSLFRDGVATGLTDQELLERFATCRDQSGELAFATLVARHGPMVMNVCRRMLRNPADADDAFQATFLVLVRRAGAIRFGTSSGSLALWRQCSRGPPRSRPGLAASCVELDEQSAETMPERVLAGRPRPAARDRRGTGAAAGQVSRGHRVVLSRGPDPRRGRCQAPLPGRHDPQPAGAGPGVAQGPARTLGTGAGGARCEPLAMLEHGPARSVVASHLIDTTARTAARLAAGQALAAIVPARLAQLVAGVSEP